jgi:hypothetical protein
LKGREVNPVIGSRILLYSYCIAFKVSPLEAYNTPANIILNMLSIHAEAKKIEQEEMEKMK